MHVVLIGTQAFTQLALNRAESAIASMKGMIGVTSNAMSTNQH